MENIHPTGHKESSLDNRYKVYCGEPIEPKYLNSNFIISEEQDSADLIIIPKGGYYRIKLDQLNFKIKEHNLSTALDKISALINHSKIEKSTPHKAIKKSGSVFSKLYALFERVDDIKEFCSLLLEADFYKEFKCIHFYTHKKGFGRVNKYYLTKSNISESNIPTSEFNKLFTSIKKSKNGSFGQSSLKSYDFEIIGTCLAKSYTLLDYNVVFLISKEDFLPQRNQDIETFNNYAAYLPYYFNLLLEKKDFELQIERNKLALKTFGIENHKKIQKEEIISNIEAIKNKSFNLFDVNHIERIGLLGELLNTLKHELSNPLFGLQLSTEILQDNIEDKEMLSEVKMAIARCQDILSNFSQLYLVESKQMNFDIIKLIFEVITLTKSRSKHITKNIFLNNTPVTNDEKLIIKSNKTILAQVFFNLIINSSQALDSNKSLAVIDVHFNIDKKKKIFNIKFSDNGPGLNGEIANKIFSPFFTTKKDGTGLGLSICRNLLHKINSEINYIKSDNGATFLLRLPYENTCS